MLQISTVFQPHKKNKQGRDDHGGAITLLTLLAVLTDSVEYGYPPTLAQEHNPRDGRLRHASAAGRDAKRGARPGTTSRA